MSFDPGSDLTFDATGCWAANRRDDSVLIDRRMEVSRIWVRPVAIDAQSGSRKPRASAKLGAHDFDAGATGARLVTTLVTEGGR